MMMHDRPTSCPAPSGVTVSNSVPASSAAGRLDIAPPLLQALPEHLLLQTALARCQKEIPSLK